MLTDILKIKIIPTFSKDFGRVFPITYPKNIADNKIKFLFQNLLKLTVTRDSLVGLATNYGLDGPGIETRCGLDCSHLTVTSLGHNEPPIQWVLNHLRGVKRTKRGVNHPPPSSTQVEEKVQL